MSTLCTKNNNLFMKFDRRLSHNGVSRRSEDTAVVVLLSHEDVSVVAPVIGPGILHEPITLSIHRSVANGENCVI